MSCIQRILLLSTLALSAGIGHASTITTPPPDAARAQATEANPPLPSSPTKPPVDTAQAAADVNPTMGTAEGGTPAQPTLSEEEVGLRFLKLVARLEHRDDLTLALVKEVTGLEFTMAPWDKHHFASEGPLASNWFYVLGFIEPTPGIGKRTYLDFRNSNARFADVTEICAHDLEYWHNAFIAMGFDAVDMRGEAELLETWRYYKNDLAFSITPQNMTPGQTERVCVRSISMSS